MLGRPRIQAGLALWLALAAPAGATNKLEAASPGQGEFGATRALLRLLPRGVRSVLQASRFVQRKDALALNRRTVWDSGTAVSPQAYDKLRTQAEAKLGSFSNVKTVFYPLSGYDAGAPFRLFPQARTIIGLDNHPFLPERVTGQIEYSPVPLQNFAFFGDIDRLKYVGPAIIGALAHAVPNFRLRAVKQQQTTELQLGTTEPTHFDLNKAKNEKAVHAVVEFDTGPGTALRRYVHLNATLLGGGRDRGAWWWKLVDRARPQAVVVKGAEGVFNDPSFLRPNHRSPSRKTTLGAGYGLRDDILGWLRAQRGVLVEESGGSVQPTEFTGRPHHDDGSYYRDARTVQLSTDYTEGFGYRNAVTISRFDQGR
jgi:hypothetical protein